MQSSCSMKRRNVGIGKAHARCRPQWGELPYMETTVQDGPGERGTLGVRVRNRSASIEAAVAKNLNFSHSC